MKKCPRCHTSMLMDYATGSEWERAWKCLGCGREVLANDERRREDEVVFQAIRQTQLTQR